MPSPTAEQSTQKPRLDHGAGLRSAASAATATTRLDAAGQHGRVEPSLPAAAKTSTSGSNSSIRSRATSIATSGWPSTGSTPSDKLMIFAPSLTARTIAHATAASLPTPSLSIARYITRSASGATWATMPAANVPWPAPKSRNPFGVGRSSSGSMLSGVARPCSQPSVRRSAVTPVSMMAMRTDRPAAFPAYDGG